jgi:N utilization substance protein A
VPEDQLSLAIGKQGQNVRLAAKLTGWNIDIMSADENHIEAVVEAAVEQKPAQKHDLEGSVIDAVNGGATDAANEGAGDVLSGQDSDAANPSK